MFKSFLKLSTQIKAVIVLISAFIIYVVFAFIFKKDEKSDLENLSPLQVRAYKCALGLKSALGTGIWWQVNADETAIIKILASNSDIIVLIENQFFILTEEKLFPELSRALTADEILKLNLRKN